MSGDESFLFFATVNVCIVGRIYLGRDSSHEIPIVSCPSVYPLSLFQMDSSLLCLNADSIGERKLNAQFAECAMFQMEVLNNTVGDVRVELLLSLAHGWVGILVSSEDSHCM